ncbi:MAG: hypothetical protein R3F62_10700 [Planctomycetota bacterium]
MPARLAGVSSTPGTTALTQISLGQLDRQALGSGFATAALLAA